MEIVEMSAYLVRMSETKEIVGLFWADTLVSLGWAIDELLDPFVCDIKRLRPSGVYWPENVDVVLPVQTEPDSVVFEEDFSGDEMSNVSIALKKLPQPELGETLWNQLYEANGWRRYADLVDFKRFVEEGLGVKFADEPASKAE